MSRSVEEIASVDPKHITITDSQRGYAHTQYYGTCGPDVTVDDVKRAIYHSYFGGRNAWVRDGQWGAICHDD